MSVSDPASRAIAADLLDVIGPIRRSLRRTMRRDLPEGALPQAQAELLGVIDRSPGIRVNEAAARLQLATNSVSTLARQLVGSGLLRRERDPADGRSIQLWVTPEGARLIAVRRDYRVTSMTDALAGLDPDTMRTLRTAVPALRRVLAHLEGRG